MKAEKNFVGGLFMKKIQNEETREALAHQMMRFHQEWSRRNPTITMSQGKAYHRKQYLYYKRYLELKKAGKI